MKSITFKAVGLASLILFAGCQADMNEEEALYHENGNGLVSVGEYNEDYNPIHISDMEDSDLTRFGYVRLQKSPISNEEDSDSILPYVFDREKAAFGISKMATMLPNVHDAATLITDEEVLIAYETDSNDRFETADQVKLSALSLIPGWYHVYVSDKEGMIKQVERFSQLNAATRNIDSYLQKTIEEMLQSPQGRDLDDDRDANNRSMYEMNEDQGNRNNGYRQIDSYYPGMTDKNNTDNNEYTNKKGMEDRD
jgi:hypothetical protein